MFFIRYSLWQILGKRKPKVQLRLNGEPLPPSGCLCPEHDDYECRCKHIGAEGMTQREWEKLTRTANRARLALVLSGIDLAVTLTLAYLVFAK